MKDKFEICDMGPVNVFIGIKITRDREHHIIYVDQSHYGRDILHLYGMADCNPCLVPMIPADQHLTRALPDQHLNDAETKNYQAILGSLGYLMNCSHPHLAFSVNKLSQFASAPSGSHLLALKRILRYLRGTTNARLAIGTSPSFTSSAQASISDVLPSVEIRGWFYASWADNSKDSWSTFGYFIWYGQTALLWKSKKHKSVILSTTDAEYLATTEITRDICFIQNLFIDLTIPFKTYINRFSFPFSLFLNRLFLPSSGSYQLYWVLTHYHSMCVFVFSLIFILGLLSVLVIVYSHVSVLGFTHYHSSYVFL